MGLVADQGFSLRLEIFEGVQLDELLPRELGLESRVGEIRGNFFRFVFARVSRGEPARGERLARVVLPRRLLRYLPVGFFVEVFPGLDRHRPRLQVLDPVQLTFRVLGLRLALCVRDPGFFRGLLLDEDTCQQRRVSFDQDRVGSSGRDFLFELQDPDELATRRAALVQAGDFCGG